MITVEGLSSELGVALAPGFTYRRLIERGPQVTWRRTLIRPAIALLIIAVVIPMMAVHRVTLGLAMTVAVSWSIAVALQCVAAACVIASAPSLRVSPARAFDLWFAGHLPYNLWLLTLPLLTSIASIPPLEVIGMTAIVPAAWTMCVVAAFCRTALGTTAAGARWRAGLHFAAVAITLSMLFIASAGGGRAILSYALRRLAG